MKPTNKSPRSNRAGSQRATLTNPTQGYNAAHARLLCDLGDKDEVEKLIGALIKYLVLTGVKFNLKPEALTWQTRPGVISEADMILINRNKQFVANYLIKNNLINQ